MKLVYDPDPGPRNEHPCSVELAEYLLNRVATGRKTLGSGAVVVCSCGKQFQLEGGVWVGKPKGWTFYEVV